MGPNVIRALVVTDMTLLTHGLVIRALVVTDMTLLTYELVFQ